MRWLIPLLLLATMAACSVSPPLPRDPETGCARPVPVPGSGDETDGGVGGTGKAPDPCAGG